MQNSLTLVVFGATGDLYQNKLSNALFNLFLENKIVNFTVFGFARRSMTDIEFRNFTKEAISKKNNEHNSNSSAEKLEEFLGHLKYFQGDLESIESFKNLSQKLGEDDARMGVCTNKLFYLAVPPTLYGKIFKNICSAGLTIPCAPGVSDVEMAWTRVLVEKPFGKDLKDAECLDQMLGELFDESQIFRIDHYLAKETMQNILSFRFVEGKFENIWNNQNIERVKIIFHETNTVENRGALYDGLGILRDVGQNHMLQMLSLATMENPGSMNVDKIREARSAVLEKIILLDDKIVRGQYEGYVNEKNVQPNSDTETFFRVSLGIDSSRWAGVPFELEAGKALDKAEVYIEICFKDSSKNQKFPISATVGVKHDAYEKVFYDCILGDQTVFTNTKEIMAEWKIVGDIIEKWQNIPIISYKKGADPKDI